MQKAEVQHNHPQSRMPQRRSGNATLESPQGEQIAQLETMVEASPQAGRLAQLAATANNSPQATAQRRMIDMIHTSPRMVVQRKAVGAIQNSPHVTAQRQQPAGLAGEPAQFEEAEEPLQSKVTQREAEPAKPNNTGLPDDLKNGIESLSGMSMDNVRVHYNSSQPAQLNALAYAQGADIHVAPGQEQHLPHEAWHVVQQAQGRVRPTRQMKEGVPLNDDKSLEHEADVMGGRAVSQWRGQGKSIESGAIGNKYAPGDRSKGSVVQGYFLINQQRTDDPEQFKDGATKEDKEAQVWAILRPALAEKWKGIQGHHFDDAMLDEFKTPMVKAAFSNTLCGLNATALQLESTKVHRLAAVTPLTGRASPSGVVGTLSTTPLLADDKVKHSQATYHRTTPAQDGPDVVTEETFDSDAYTKGPSRRTRDEGGMATTPKSGAQTWTKKQIKASISVWTGDMPLVRHLAVTVWPLLGDTDLGRSWEVKFREMDRLISYRDSEGQSRFITVKRSTDQATVKEFDRKNYNKPARLAMKDSILAGTAHPAAQQGVLFYDALLKNDADGAWRVTDSATFQVGPGYSVVGDLSMILTHWRPILLFDWILAEDVLNNAADA